MTEDPFLDYLKKQRHELFNLGKACVDRGEGMKYTYAACTIDSIMRVYGRRAFL